MLTGIYILNNADIKGGDMAWDGSWIRRVKKQRRNTMDVGDKVETTCEYARTVSTNPVKGRIRSFSKDNDEIARIELSCGCMTSMNIHWLRRTSCCHHACCCSH
jgi:hypothetical protein